MTPAVAIEKLRALEAGATKTVGVMADALDLADRLIERGYGSDTPKEWHEAISNVVAARAALSLLTAAMEQDNG
jgi:hypothetical protein